MILRRSPDPRRVFVDKLLALDAELVKHGFPAFSPWWRKEVKRFLLSDRRRWVARVGRRGGKSTTWCKVAVAVALFGVWAVPAGDVGVVAFLSVDKLEAQQRLRTIAAMLSALGVEYVQRAEDIELKGARPVVFRVYPASIRAVGFTCVFAVCDEVGRWLDRDTGANPAREVIASLAPALATQPTARLVLSSSPWTKTDYHGTEFDRGDTADQLVSHAPTWEANPSVSEADTHALEPDLRIWSREYAAVPTDAISSFCSAEDYDAVVAVGVKRRPPDPSCRYRVLVDVGLRHDRTAVFVFHVELRERPGSMPVRVLVVDHIELLVPTMLHRVKIEEVEAAVVAAVNAYGGAVYSDSHYFDALAPLLRTRGIVAHQAPMASAAQSARAAALQSRFSARTLDLLDHEELRKETLQAQIVHHQGGRITVSAPNKRGAHDDVLDCLLLACDADIGGKLPASGGGLEVEWDPFTGRRVYYRNDPRVGRLSVAAPVGTPEHERQQRERLSRGVAIKSDFAELGEEGVARLLFAPVPAHPVDKMREALALLRQR